ncbi:hypothetical protein V1515DRAFT_590827 [Lipomyces mesembrius]
MRHKVKGFSLSGAYRHVLVIPGNVEWWYRRYSDPLQQMVRTDLDIVRARTDKQAGWGVVVLIINSWVQGSHENGDLAQRRYVRHEVMRDGQLVDGALALAGKGSPEG